MSSFTTPLVVTPVSDTTRWWKLVEAFEYHVGGYTSKLVIHVPEGFSTNFASVPRVFWAIYPPWGKYGKAAVVHDYLYKNHNGFTRKEADDIFLEGMAVLKVSKFTRKTMHF